jgi:hypothetical protein
VYRFPALELGKDAFTFVRHTDPNDLLAKPEHGAELTQLEAEALDDFAVREIEQHRPLIEQRDPDTERGEHRRVLQPDDTGAHHHQLAGELVEFVHLIRVEYPRAVYGYALIVGRARAAGNQDPGSPDDLRSVVARDFDRVRVEEARVTVEDGDAVAVELRLDYLDLARHDRLRAKDQIVHGDLILDRVTPSVEGALPQTA